jgi:hypothetical protein
MADEITISSTFSLRNGSNVFSWTPGSITIDQSASGGPSPGYVTIGTSEESIAFSELAAQGYLIIHNLSPTNFIRWGFSTGVYGGRLNAGEYCILRLNPGSTLFLIANVAACKCHVYGFEN